MAFLACFFFDSGDSCVINSDLWSCGLRLRYTECCSVISGRTLDLGAPGSHDTNMGLLFMGLRTMQLLVVFLLWGSCLLTSKGFKRCRSTCSLVPSHLLQFHTQILVTVSYNDIIGYPQGYAAMPVPRCSGRLGPRLGDLCIRWCLGKYLETTDHTGGYALPPGSDVESDDSGLGGTEKFQVLARLVGGLEHDFYFSIYWEWYSQLTNIFQRGWNQQPEDVFSRFGCSNIDIMWYHVVSQFISVRWRLVHLGKVSGWQIDASVNQWSWEKQGPIVRVLIPQLSFQLRICVWCEIKHLGNHRLVSCQAAVCR